MNTSETLRARYAFGITLFVVVIILGLFFMNKKAAAPSTVGDMATTTPVGTSTNTVAGGTSVDLGNGVVAHLPPGAHITVLDNKIPTPPLTTPIVFVSSVSPEAQSVIRTNEEATVAELKKDSTRVDLWLKLGGYRKMAGDYEGAAAAWQYVATAGPKSINYVAYGNLGDLYMNFLKDYTKAESNYKIAITLSPTTIDYYRNLSMLYTNQLHDTAKARATLEAGLKANPQNPDLTNLLKALQ